jgi:uncharacterized protein YecE (DUF72 family)
MARPNSAMSRRAATRSGQVSIGISGWRYAGWRGSFYPKELRQPENARLIDIATRPRRSARDVHVCFDNDAKVHAPFDAQSLRKRLTR